MEVLPQFGLRYPTRAHTTVFYKDFTVQDESKAGGSSEIFEGKKLEIPKFPHVSYRFLYDSFTSETQPGSQLVQYDFLFLCCISPMYIYIYCMPLLIEIDVSTVSHFAGKTLLKMQLRNSRSQKCGVTT